MARKRRKKLRRVTRDLCAQDFINRAARFLFVQGPAKRKPLNGTTQRAWQEKPGMVKAAGGRALLLQKNNPAAFCFGQSSGKGAQTCIDRFNRK
jgi:hypothetical protein